MEPFLEILETIFTYPIILILGRVPLVQYIGIVFNHELHTTEFTVIMIPILTVSCIMPPIELYALEEFLLPL